MKPFSENFKAQLYQTIDEIESSSLIEVVAVVKAQTRSYKDVSLLSGAILLFLAYTYFMFAPTIFDVYLIYLWSLMAFIIGFALVEFIPAIKRMLIPNKKLDRDVEIYSRAIFQKGGVRHTSEKVGVLIFVSLFEKRIVIIADRGAESALPGEEWKKIRAGFQNIFGTQNMADAFIMQLKNCKLVFSEYLPSTEDDVNELPDDLDVDL